MSVIRRTCRSNLVIRLIFSLSALASYSQAGGPGTQTIAALRDSIDALRFDGSYEAAHTVACSLFVYLGTDQDVPAFQVKDAERLVETLADIAALDSTARAELAAADHLSEIANETEQQGDLIAAEGMRRRQLEIRQRYLSADHPDISASLNDLALTLQNLGQYEESIDLARRSLAIDRAVLGEDHPYVALGLNNLGLAHKRSGNYEISEAFFSEAIALFRRSLGTRHHRIATSLNNLGLLMKDLGRYALADSLLNESLAMSVETLGEEHRNVASTLNNLGLLAQASGNLDAAREYYQQALAIHELISGRDHPARATAISNLALLLQELGSPREALALHEESLAIRRSAYGDRHPSVAIGVNNLAGVRRDLGQMVQAETLFSEALEMYRGALGESHHLTIGCMISRARVLASLGMLDQAISQLEEAAGFYDIARRRLKPGLSRSTFVLRPPDKALATLQLRVGEDQAAWRSLERSQGRSLGELLLDAGGRTLTPEESKREAMLRLELSGLSRRLVAMDLAAGHDAPDSLRIKAESTRTEMIEAENRWRRFQADLSVRDAGKFGLPYDLKTIQRSLAPDRAIVGWLDDPASSDTTETIWTYVLRGDGPVIWSAATRELPGMADARTARYDSVEDRYRKQLRESADPFFDSGSMQALGKRIYAERFLGAMDALASVHHLIVVSSGDMLGVPVECLPINARQLLQDRFTVSYAPSATAYAWLIESQASQQRPDKERFLLIGDPTFKTPETADPRIQNSPVTMRTELQRADRLRAALIGDRAALSDLPPLPGTREEVLRIGAHVPEPTILTGRDASEEALTAMASSGELARFSAIHFATHALVNEQRPERSALVLSLVDRPDPLETAVLGLPYLDGLVTIAEVLREWRIDADLVTLSACETGLGQRVDDEGLVGFSQAFLQVGARSLLVSLWQIQDQATTLLMERFYANLLDQNTERAADSVIAGPSKAEALREAKNWLRTYRGGDATPPYARPYYWAGVILIGDPD